MLLIYKLMLITGILSGLSISIWSANLFAFPCGDEPKYNKWFLVASGVFLFLLIVLFLIA